MNIPMDGPLDYKALWFKFRAVIAATGHREAERCATAKEERDIRKGQGGYEMCRTLIAVMDEIVQSERGGEVVIDDSDLDS